MMQGQDFRGQSLVQGRYQIEQLIATGSVATIYLAHDRHLDAKVAIRVVHAQFTQDGQFAMRFVQAARMAILHAHPSLVRVFDFGSNSFGSNSSGSNGESAAMYVVAERMTSPTLAERLANLRDGGRWLALDEAMYVIQRLGEALAYVRRHKLPTRRLTPSQIMFRHEVFALTGGRFTYLPVLVEFALDVPTNLLSDAKWLESLAFLAPEVLFRQEGGEQSDVYMLGALAWELAVGTPFLQAQSSAEAVDFHLRGLRRDVRQVHDALPEPVAAWLEKALAHAPDQRFTSLRAMLEALAAIPVGMLYGIHPAGITVEPLVVGGPSVAATPAARESGVNPWAGVQRPSSAPSFVPGAMMPSAQPEISSPSAAPIATPESTPASGEASIPVATPSNVSPLNVSPVVQAAPLEPAGFVLQIQGPTMGPRVVALSKPITTIGRAAENDVILEHPRVSRKHARLELEGGQFFVVDLNSSNGVAIEGTRVPSGDRLPWPVGAAVTIGEHELRLLAQSPDLVASPALASAHPLPGEHSGPMVTPQSVTPQSVVRSRATTSNLQLEKASYEVEPGQPIRIPIIVANGKEVADELMLSVLGVPGAWLNFPSMVSLGPGDKERIYLEIQPARTPQTTVGFYPLQIVAASQKGSGPETQAHVQLQVLPYGELRVELQPSTVNEGEPMRVRVENLGNGAQSLKFLWWDDQGELSFQPPEAERVVQAGTTDTVEFIATGQKMGWRESAKSCIVKVQVHPQVGQMQLSLGTIIRRGGMLSR